MGRSLARALHILRIRGRFFRFNPLRLGVGITLSADDTVATEGGPDNGHVAVYASEATPGRVFRATIGLAHPNSGSPAIGVGTSSASLAASVGDTADSSGLVPQPAAGAAKFFAGGADLGTLGIGAVTTADIIDMEIGTGANAGKLRFRKNSGSYSSWFAHGLTGTVYIGVGFRTTSTDYVTGVWLS